MSVQIWMVNKSPEVKKQKAAKFRHAERVVFRTAMRVLIITVSARVKCGTDYAVLSLNHRGKVVTWIVGKMKN